VSALEASVDAMRKAGLEGTRDFVSKQNQLEDKRLRLKQADSRIEEQRKILQRRLDESVLEIFNLKKKASNALAGCMRGQCPVTLSEARRLWMGEIRGRLLVDLV
jgi:hypothetical protein